MPDWILFYMNFDQITPALFVGSAPDHMPDDVQTLLDFGISHVMNCRAEADDPPLIKARFVYDHNGTPDWDWDAALGNEPKPVSWFKAVLDFWEIVKKAGGKLFVHCTMGANRSVLAAYTILRREGKSPDEAILILAEHRIPAIWGAVFDGAWRVDCEHALRELGYIQ